jgi:hypothetical protein
LRQVEGGVAAQEKPKDPCRPDQAFRFGDFEGFNLLTEEGHERTYFSHEDEIETLARFAWRDRVVITVVSDETHRYIPVRIILRRAPSSRDVGLRH